MEKPGADLLLLDAGGRRQGGCLPGDRIAATVRQGRPALVAIKSGKERWKKDKVGTYHASLLRTGDSKLLMLDDFGNLSLVEPNAKEYKQLARSKVCGQTWAHPALSGGRLYLRDRGELICLSLK